ncbi:MAG: Na+/H+ antiporter NhaC [Synergistaceae bacterium]
MEPRKPSLFLSLLVLIVVTSLMAVTLALYRQNIHIALIFGSLFATFIGVFFLKNKYKTVEKSMISGVMSAMQACLILYTVGPLVGIWIYTGVIPSMIYYGLTLIHPGLYLIVSLLICTIVAFATGTSWGTSGTVGIALMGIAIGLGIPAPLSAGIIISGAYCGDKLSPNSDTTFVATSVTGATIKGHIKSMLWTTLPTYIIVLIIATTLSVKYGMGNVDTVKVEAIKTIIKSEFWINPITFIAPIAVIALTAMKKPTLPSLWVGILISLPFLYVNGTDLKSILDVMQNGYMPTISQNIINNAENALALTSYLADNAIQLTNEEAISAAKEMITFTRRGGLLSMNWTIALVLCAFTFGSVMEACGFVRTVLESLMKPAKSVAGMVTATVISCFVCDFFLADQYLSISMPGKMFKPIYDKKGLHSQMLSRTLEDAGTTISALVPWNTCGAYQANVLNVTTWEYLPFAFFNYLSPFVAIIISSLGIAIYWKGKSGEAYRGGKNPPFGTLMSRGGNLD